MEKRKNRMFGFFRHLVVLALLFGFGAHAAAEAPLSWEEAVRLTIRHNPEISAAHEALQKGKADLKGSFSTLLPQLSANASYSSGSGTNYGASLSAQQTLWNGGQN